MHSQIKRSVIGIVFNSQQHILLIKRRDVPIWVLPGGGVDPGESPEHAVMREVQEETGLTVEICRQVALYTPINKLSNDTYTFECQIIAGDLQIGDETLQVKFFALNRLPVPFFFLHEEWLADARLNLPTIIQKPLSQVTYWAFFKYMCCHPFQVFRILLSRFGKPINS